VQRRLQRLVMDVGREAGTLLLTGALQALVERVEGGPLRLERAHLGTEVVHELRVTHDRGEVAAERRQQGAVLVPERLAIRLGA